MTATTERSGELLPPALRPPLLHGPVVLASNGTPGSSAAAAAARHLAHRLDVKLHVVAVVPPPQVYAGTWDVPMLPVETEALRRQAMHDGVVRTLEPVLKSREHWHVEMRSGAPAAEIADTAREQHAGLIVLGTGRHRIADRLLGEETSLHVIRHADTPVLAVTDADEGRYTRAVVGMDFSAASIRAAMTALALLEPGRDDGAALTLVHVRPPLDSPHSALMAWTADYEDRVLEMMKRVKAFLLPMLPAGVALESRMRSGLVRESLEAVAIETSADLIAVGTRNEKWFDRLVVGSVATSVVRHSPVSVLVAPAPAPAERIRLELRVAGRLDVTQQRDWGVALTTFTHRNRGRLARLEASGHGLRGFVVESEGYRFRGATYDPHHERIDLMLGGDPDTSRHLTHGIGNIRAVSIIGDDALRDRALVVEERDGDVVLTFID